MTAVKNELKRNEKKEPQQLNPAAPEFYYRAFPNNLQTKWCKTVVKGRRKDGKIAGFGDLTKFVEHAGESVNNPIYSKDTLSNAKSKAGSASSFTNYNHKLLTSRPKSTSFATKLESPTQTPSSHGERYSRRNAAVSRCSLCHKSHDLEECEDFRLPVLITDKNTNKTVKTYAFYDDGSGGCFLTEHLTH